MVALQEPSVSEAMDGRRFHVSYFALPLSFLAEILPLPKGMQIQAMSAENPLFPGMTLFRVQDERLPGTPEAHPMPQLDPILSDKGEYLSWDWNAQGLMPGVEPTVQIKPKEMAALLKETLAFIHKHVHGATLMALPDKLRKVAKAIDPEPWQS